ncbi:MAG TPA: thioesterase [Spongiibacteraceae bacterium]|nr:thioesterase [Spongiibacteraceae bacterium]MBN51806.1 thioesterase [Spongiibacteraceae bacterium]HCS29138.1 thioesterase [Spongiibacteraceae bacterium]|tara:strand:- start:339 stop:767 length:429 start_codon:yes stop_codon:yes gene_type:complete
MSRVTLNLPEHFAYSTDIPLMVDHINSGNHLGNDSLITLINEARARYTRHCGLLEYDRETGLMMVNADLAMVYHSEGRYGEVVVIEVAATDFHRCGYDLVYRVADKATGRAIASAKTAHILIDAVSGQTLSEPEGYFDCLRA